MICSQPMLKKKPKQNQVCFDISFLNEFEGLFGYGEAHGYMFMYKRISKNTHALVLYSLKFNTSDWMLINAKTKQDIKRIIEKAWGSDSLSLDNNVFGEGIINIHYCHEYPEIMNMIRAAEDFAREYHDSNLDFASINSLLKKKFSGTYKYENKQIENNQLKISNMERT